VKAILFQPSRARLGLSFAFSRLTRRPATFAAGVLVRADVQEAALSNDDEVRVRPILSGICGTDLNKLRFEFSLRSASFARDRSVGVPVCLGHEAVGIVVEVGSRVSHLEVGQRVGLLPGEHCRTRGIALCEYCRIGRVVLCLHRDDGAAPINYGAAWSDRFIRHQSQLIAIPDRVTDDDAVLLDPLASAFHSVHRCTPTQGQRVIVIGGGTMGLCVISILRALQPTCKITAVVRHDFQAKTAYHLGADHTLTGPINTIYPRLAEALKTRVTGSWKWNLMLAGGASVVYDMVGSGETLHHSLRWAEPGGTVVIEGINAFSASLDRTPIWLREIDVRGAHGYLLGNSTSATQGGSTPAKVLAMLLEGKISTTGIITHRFRPQDFRKAIQFASNKRRSGAIKVVFDHRDAEPQQPDKSLHQP
jgi:threonine dehydrogenase-like Zn-dependent dehydrogenase